MDLRFRRHYIIDPFQYTDDHAKKILKNSAVPKRQQKNHYRGFGFAAIRNFNDDEYAGRRRVPLVSDSIRNADDDNPNGYFEFEPVKQLSEGQNEWLVEADHKVVKIISALLEYLPAGHHYKIIFMERDIKEILASQRKMLNRRKEESKISDEEMEDQFHKHLADTKYWLARQSNMEVLYVDYNQLM